MLKSLHRPLVIAASVMAVGAVLSLIGIFADSRSLLGVPIWLKPFKFFISTVIYDLTLAWLISLVTIKGQRIAWWLGTVVAAGLGLELLVIAGQAARGHRSHFNVSSPLDATLWSIMGSTIVIVWLATAWIGILLLRQRIPDRANALAIRLGLAVALFGLATGFFMTSPTSAQLSSMKSGQSADFVGAHTVGVDEGGPGIPLINWSSTGGDLRVPHFVGMHALQALPLLAFGLLLLARRFPALASESRRMRLIIAYAIFHAGLTGVVLWQALRGQSLIHPDALTLTAFAVVAGASVLVAASSLTLRKTEVSVA